MEKGGKKLLGSQIEDSLMEYILNEPVAIGEKLPNEFELAEKFGVGRSTIREAVKSLVSKGVLEVRRGSGTYVVSTSSLEEDPLGLGRFCLLYTSTEDSVYQMEPGLEQISAVMLGGDSVEIKASVTMDVLVLNQRCV